jgi:splicing factor 3B subunit 3
LVKRKIRNKKKNFFLFSLSLMRFDTRPADTFLLVGVARDLALSPRSHLGGMIYCFLVLENGERLHFIHRTVVDEIPSRKITDL